MVIWDGSSRLSDFCGDLDAYVITKLAVSRWGPLTATEYGVLPS